MANSLACLLALLLSGSDDGTLQRAAPRKLLVVPLDVRPGIPAEQANVLREFVVTEARRLKNHQVLSQSDIVQMLDLEKQQQLSGCTTDSCLAELAGALNADEVLYGSLGPLGEREMVLTLNRVDPRSATALAGQAERLTAVDSDAMLDRAARLLARLYGDDYELPPVRSRPMNPFLLTGLLTLVGAAVQYGAFSSIFTIMVLGAGPLGIGLVVTVPLAIAAGSACMAAPLLTTWGQAWFADLIGRRQMGVRRAALVGILMLPVFLVGGAAVGLLVTLAASGGAGALFAASMRGQLRRDLIPLEVGLGLSGILALLWGLSAAIPCWSAGAVLTPLVQAAVLMWGAGERPKDEAPQAPSLYAPHEEPLGLLSWALPYWLVGGKRPAPQKPPALSAEPPSRANPSRDELDRTESLHR